MNKIEQTKIDALNWAKISLMPDKLSKRSKKIWITAIVSVVKKDGSMNFAVAKNDGYGNPRLMKDFGNSAVIAYYKEIYPFDYVTEDCTPVLRNQGDILTYLSAHGFKEDVIQALMSDKKSDGKAKTDEEKTADTNELKRMKEYSFIKDALVVKKYE